MTPEELLKPRYKVIADWPGSNLKIGTTLRQEITDYYSFEEDEKAFTTHRKNLDQYPHLFRKLQWWEERTLEEMPQYIKFDNIVYKTIEWRIGVEMECRTIGNRGAAPARKFLPATEQDYLTYQTIKQ